MVDTTLYITLVDRSRWVILPCILLWLIEVLHNHKSFIVEDKVCIMYKYKVPLVPYLLISEYSRKIQSDQDQLPGNVLNKFSARFSMI